MNIKEKHGSNGLLRAFSVLKHMLFPKGFERIFPVDVKSKVDSKQANFIILDVRNTHHYKEGHIKGALSVPFSEFLGKEPAELDKNKEIIVTCYGGGISKAAASILAEKGFTKVYNMDGGMHAWSYKTVKSKQ